MTIKQAVILAGGRGLRLQELTGTEPKALLKIGSHSMLELIVYHLSLHGIENVVIAGGYRCADLEASGIRNNNFGVSVQIADTGLETNTGERVLAVSGKLVAGPFLLCWCDALSDLDFSLMITQHLQSDAPVTLAAVHPPARFGDLALDQQRVVSYAEKASQLERWISGGYFAVDPDALAMISGPDSSWEHDVLTPLASQGKLDAYRHEGAWRCMDTIYEHHALNHLLDSGEAFWPRP